MTVTNQLKIIYNKIKANQAQYDLDRLATKISALSLNDLDKYKYLTGEDLGLKSNAVEQVRFEYSLLGKFFNTELKEEDKKEKIIEGKNEDQLKAIKDQGKKQLDAIKNINTDSKSLKTINFFGKLSPEAKELMNEIREVENDIDPENLVCAKSGKKSFNFNIFRLLFKFAANIYDGKTKLEEAKKDQHKKFKQLEDLKRFDPNNPDNIREKEQTLINTEKVYNNRNNVNNAFENGVFPFKDGLEKKKNSQRCLIHYRIA